MTDLLLHNVRAMQPGEGIVASSLLLRDGWIEALDPNLGKADSVRKIDGGGRLLTPGLIDIHAHGIRQFLYENSAEDLWAGLASVGRYGVTCVLPTLYRATRPDQLPTLERLADALDCRPGQPIPGFHLEGPFLALPGAGAATCRGDVAQLEEILAAAKYRVTAMSISPDTPGILPVIECLMEHGIAAFMTHTQASVEQTQAAIDAGARHATHFLDVFPMPQEIEPGVRPVGAVEAILADPRVTVDFIADGVHVHPTAIRATLAAKGYDKIVLITDSNVGAGLPGGTYDTPWGFAVDVRPGDAARMVDPSDPSKRLLAGSALTADVGMANLRRWLDLPDYQVWAMGTRNAAALFGWANKGVIRQGADADLVLWNEADGRLQAVQTWVGGRCVFDVTVDGEN